MSGLDAPLGFVLGGGAPSSTTDSYARMMVALLPPGKLWRLFGASLITQVLAASANELARVESRANDLLSESIPSKALELLPEYEQELDLDASGTTEERQARVAARYVARQRLRPVDLQNALAPLLGLAPADVVVLERSHAIAASMGDDREHYRFFVYRDPALPGTYYLDSAQALVDDICRSSCVGHVIESVDFLCDDPYSLCDRDLLGA